MKNSIQSSATALTAATAILFALSIPSAPARPGGTYKGSAVSNAFTPDGGVAMPFEDTPIKIRLPNRKGKIKGTLFTTQHAVPKFADVDITGRIKKAVDRQGGKKHILTGNWTWGDFVEVGPAGFDSGKARIIIRKVGRKYKFKPPVKVNLRGTGPPHTFTSKVSATK